MFKYQAIIFIGPQGSGKGTQARLLIPKISAEYVEMGYVLRTIAASGTAFGDQIKQTIDGGNLVSDKILEKIITEKLATLSPDAPVIFDGVPRMLHQAEFLIADLKRLGRGAIATIFIDLPRDAGIQRILTRFSCQNCKAPKTYAGDDAAACARCGGVMVRRVDDSSEEAVERRLDTYERETLPVLDYLKTTTDFFTIDGRPSVPEVEKQIDNCLEIEHAKTPSN